MSSGLRRKVRSAARALSPNYDSRKFDGEKYEWTGELAFTKIKYLSLKRKWERKGYKVRHLYYKTPDLVFRGPWVWAIYIPGINLMIKELPKRKERLIKNFSKAELVFK